MQITNYLFRNHHRLGDDLRAIDVQRNRDHGLAIYNDYRALAGLPRAVQWTDFGDLISAEVIIISIINIDKKTRARPVELSL